MQRVFASLTWAVSTACFNSEENAWNGQKILNEDKRDTPAVTSPFTQIYKIQKKWIPQSTEQPLSFSNCNDSEKCGWVQHSLPGRMQQASPKLLSDGLLKSSMSILLQSQDIRWEKLPPFISLKT